MRYIVWVDSDKIPGMDDNLDVRYFTEFIRKEQLGPALQEVFLYKYGMAKKSKANKKSDIPLYDKLSQYLERRKYDLPDSKEITRAQVWNQNINCYRENSWFQEEFPVVADKSSIEDSFMEELKVALLVSVQNFPLTRSEEPVKNMEVLQSCIKDYYCLLKPLENKGKDLAYESLLQYAGALIEAGVFIERAADLFAGYIPRKNDEFSKLYYWCISQIYALPGIKLREIVLDKLIDIIKNHERNSMYAYECKAYIEKYISQIRNIIGTMIMVAENIGDDARYDAILFQKIKESLVVTIKQGEKVKKSWTPVKEDIVFSLYKEINASLMNGDISVNTFLIDII